MTSIRRILSLAVVCLAVSSFAFADTTDDWNAAFAAGDAEALGALYAEGGMLLPPNAAIVEGREAVAAFLKVAMDGGLLIVLTTEYEDVDNDTMTKRLSYTATFGGQVVEEGKAIEVWKQGDDGWQMIYDIWNSNSPAPGAAPTE